MVNGRQDLESHDTTDDYVLDTLDGDAAAAALTSESNGLLQDPDYSSQGGNGASVEQDHVVASKYGDHPRDGLPTRQKWKLFLIVNGLAASIHGERRAQVISGQAISHRHVWHTDRCLGYGVGCVSNVDALIYKDFRSISLLPLISLTYPVVAAACVPLAGWFVKIYDLKPLYLISLCIIMAGYILAGVAPNIRSVIAGRAIMAAGGSVLYQW